MIVNYTESGWQVITQRSHGLLAGQIYANWKVLERSSRWVDILIAVSEHDDVYNEFENMDLLNSLGGPVNFKHTYFDLRLSQRLIAMAETKSAYIALLISRHIQFIHGNEPKAKVYIKQLKMKEKIWMEVSDCKPSEVSHDYELLEFCDAFSLLICQGLIPPENRKIEISNGPDKTSYQMYGNESNISVQPWPFEEKSFKIKWESRTLQQLNFANVEEFRYAIVEAPVNAHELEVKAVI